MRNEPIKLRKNIVLAERHTHKTSLRGCTSKSNFPSPLARTLTSLRFLLNHLVIGLLSGKKKGEKNESSD